MRTTAKSLIIEANNKKDLDTITTNERVKQHFKCKMPKKRKPLVIIYDVTTRAKL